MISKLFDRLFSKREIVNCDREVYLIRWYLIRTKHFAVFLHKFIRSDEDRFLHDHPWNFIVIPIWRGYVEHSEYYRDLDPDRDRLQIGDEFTFVNPLADKGGVFGWMEMKTLGLLESFETGFKYRRLIRRRTRVWPLWSARARKATYRHRVELLACPEHSRIPKVKPENIFWDPESIIKTADPENYVPCPMCDGLGELPSWSLFIRFREFRDWGFWTPTGFLHWKLWWKEKC